MENVQGVNPSIPYAFNGGIVMPLGGCGGVKIARGTLPFLEAVQLEGIGYAVLHSLYKGLVHIKGRVGIGWGWKV